MTEIEGETFSPIAAQSQLKAKNMLKIPWILGSLSGFFDFGLTKFLPEKPPPKHRRNHFSLDSSRLYIGGKVSPGFKGGFL